MKNIMVEWAATSSCHGVHHMVEAHSLLVIIVWSLILLVALFSFIYLFHSTLVEYLAYEKVVNLNVRQTGPSYGCWGPEVGVGGMGGGAHPPSQTGLQL